MAKRKLEASSTPFPKGVPLSKPIPQLDDATRTQLGQAVGILIDQNLGNRAAIDNSLDIWNAIVEMRRTTGVVPWEGASQIVTPTVFSAYQEFCSRVIGSVLVPRPYTMRGNDPISSQYAHLSEQFYNAEFDENDCFDAYDQAIRLTARDGLSIMEVLYELTTHEEMYETDEPVYDAMGNPVLGPDGQQKTAKKQYKAKFVDYDAPRETAVGLKEFIVLPNFDKTINTADGVARKLWFTEHDLNKKVNAGIFFEETVEQALGYVSTGQGEHSTDPQGTSELTVNNRISIVDSAVAPPDGMAMSRGPLEVWRVHTNLFDLDGDGVPEENLIWIHYNSRLCLGYAPFDYPGGRPFFPLSLIPRTDVLYGFSVAEIGRSTQEEVDTQTNARLNMLDLAVKPPRYKTEGAKFKDESRRWEPDTEITVQKKDDFGFVEPPHIPQESMQEEDKLTARLDRAVGSPQAGAASPPVGGTQQRSARAAQFQAQMQSLNSNLVNTRARRWMLAIFKYKHGLYIRYGKNQLETVEKTQNGAQRLTVPKEILALDYTLGVSGLGGALDKETRRSEFAMLVQMIVQFFPQLMQGKITRQWNLARQALETYDIPDVTSIIGTLEEAKESEQQAAQAQETAGQMEMLKQIVSHMSGKGVAGGA